MSNKEEILNWLLDNLENNENDIILNRDGRLLKSIAGFRNTGMIFCIYQDINNKEYCAHADYEWDENDPPNLGYIDASTSWNDLVNILANRYCVIRQSSLV